MHARGVLANDRQKTLAALTIFHCSCLERFHKSKYRGERRAQLMRDVREEFLSYDLQTFSSSDVKEHAQRSFGVMAVATQRHNPKVKYQAFWPVGLYLYAATLFTFKAVKESTVDRWIARQLR